MTKFGSILIIFTVTTLATAYVNSRENCKKNESKCTHFEDCAELYNPFNQLKEKINVHVNTLEDLIKYQKTRRVLTDYVNRIHLKSCGFDVNDPSMPMVCCPLPKSEEGNLNAGQVETSDDSPLITNNNKQFSCGRKLWHENFGNKTDLDDYPWLALLEYDAWNGFRYEKKIMCGGVLVSDRYVLTSADCVTSLANNVASVILGEYDLRNATDCLDEGDSLNSVACIEAPQKIDVGKIIVEKQLALVRLKNQVKFSSTVNPICLPETEAVAKRRFTVAGWSKSLIPNEIGYFQKLQATLTNLGGNECHAQVLYNSEKQICAGTPNERSCIADGGGPLMSVERKKDGSVRDTVFGVSVMSLSCTKNDTKSLPGVFEKVYNYMQWIRKYVEVDN